MKKVCTIILAALLIFSLAGCARPDEVAPTTLHTETPIISETTSAAPHPSSMPAWIPTSSLSPAPSPMPPDFEVELVAKTLRGECYDDQPDDKREVVKVICNRVSAPGFGDSIEAVITAPRQFVGYRPGNVPTADDYAIAREILTEWYDGGCVPLGEYLFFSSGDDRQNVFRKEWRREH